MKTKRLILTISLVALALVAFGQSTYFLERLFPDQDDEVEYLYATHTEQSQVDIWLHNLEGWASKKVSWDVYETPLVSRTFYVKQAEVLYEENIPTEDWMRTPFECNVLDQNIRIESWMTAPFTTGIAEEEIKLEEWMKTPFITKQPFRVKEWML